MKLDRSERALQTYQTALDSQAGSKQRRSRPRSGGYCRKSSRRRYKAASGAYERLLEAATAFGVQVRPMTPAEISKRAGLFLVGNLKPAVCLSLRTRLPSPGRVPRS